MIYQRRRRRAMMSAIDKAAGDCSRLAGARVIRDFEHINGLKFDPLDSTHVLMVSGMAKYRIVALAMDAFKKNPTSG